MSAQPTVPREHQTCRIIYDIIIIIIYYIIIIYIILVEFS